MPGQILSNLIAATPGIISAVGGIAATRQSNQIANENLAYQKAYNQQVFERADSAFTRAAADMERAGLSKTLAAGSPAQVGGTGAAPQKADTGQIALQNAINVANAFAGLQKTKAEIANINASTAYQNTVNENYGKKLESDIKVAESQIGLNTIEKELKTIESKYADRIHFEQIQSLCADVLNKKANRSLTQKEIELKAEQIANTIQERQNLSQSEKNAALEYSRSLLEYYARSRDLNINQLLGLYSTGPSSIVGKIGTDLVNPVLSTIFPEFKFDTYNPNFGFSVPYSLGGGRSW